LTRLDPDAISLKNHLEGDMTKGQTAGERPKIEGAVGAKVVEHVRRLIEDGSLHPGDRLPAERDLALQIKVSRPSLRSGLRTLQAMGVIEARQGSGTYIADGPPKLGDGPLRFLAALHGFTRDEMFEARRVLEVGTAGLAAERATPEQIALIADEVTSMFASLDDPQTFLGRCPTSSYRTIARIIAAAEDRGLMVRIPTSLFELRLSKATVDHLDDLPMITLQPPMSSSDFLVVKRLMDIVVSLAALVFLFPLFVLLAVLIRIDSRGGVLFFQERVGQGMKRFRIVKFRTMVPEAEARVGELESCNEVAGAAFKMKNDPRVTRLGRALRKLSLDELPQFWNVLKGDMSLVGPRPLPVRDFLKFEKRTQKRRFSVKPGLTCIWQVNGRHEIGFDDWMDLDLEYIDNWSLGLDLEIILKTLPAVLRGTGAN